jgi:hypothetical protein
LFVVLSRIASQRFALRPPNISIRQHRLKTVLVRQDTGMADIRVLLTDKTIAQLPAPEDGWYLARDTEIEGLLRRNWKTKTDIYSSRRSPTGPKARLIHQSIDRGYF